MQAALTLIIRQCGQTARHEYAKDWQLLDVDISSVICGRQAEGATKGFFSSKRNFTWVAAGTGRGDAIR